MSKKLLGLILALLFLLTPLSAARAASDAPLNRKCTLDWKGFCNYPSRLTDNNFKTGVDLKKGATGGIYWTSDVPVGIVYWEWILPPDECRYTFYDADNRPLSTSVRYREGERGYLTVPEGARGVTLEVIRGYGKGGCRLTEWHVYDAARLPADVHLWEMAPEKCDIMLVACHSDDELVMMGGIIPTYAAERGIAYIVRGVRCASDFDYEYSLAAIMKRFDADLETVMLPAEPSIACVSSTYVRELIKYGHPIGDAMPKSAARLAVSLYGKK